MTDHAETVVAGRATRVHLASPTAAIVVALLMVILAAAVIVLSLLLSHEHGTASPLFIALALPFAVVGFLAARRQPQNAIGWVLLGVASCFLLISIGRAYSVLDYRIHHGSLPLGWMAVPLTDFWTPLFLLMGLPMLLFPAGTLPSPRWRWSLWVYAIAGGFLSVTALADGIGIALGPHVQIDKTGMATNNVDGVLGVLGNAAEVCSLIALALTLTWIVRLVTSYRRARGDNRQQLKWLMTGGAVTVIAVGLGASGVLPSGPTPSGIGPLLLSTFIVLGFLGLPIGLAMGILKYRLYDVDRLISRTLSYAIVTGLLIGVYVCLVTLATRVLPFSSPIGVAASTLCAVALFNPLRRRVQRLVDRRFNRARYNAEATVAAFAQRVRDDVDLDVVSSAFVRAVQSSVEPAHVSLWLRPNGSGS
ncbi:MAG: hypothetical protein WBF51_04410 [Candidatus Dormiibacterota bacterium]